MDFIFNLLLFIVLFIFRALLDRDKDEEMPNLIVLLCESFVAIYMSLLSYALATCDAHILYRLVGQNVANSLWSAVFGGKVLVKYKRFKKIAWIQSHHLHLQRKLKLLACGRN